MSIDRQLSTLQDKVQLLEELQRQLSEVKGRDKDVDQSILDAYLRQATARVSSIESSLDRGLVGPPQADLERPKLTEKDVPKPDIKKTPYTEEIEAAYTFFQEAKDSDIAKKGIAEFADGVARSEVLPRHISN